jgi:histidinol phosphatase-like enzyme (inositol monophosphatase family)
MAEVRAARPWIGSVAAAADYPSGKRMTEHERYSASCDAATRSEFIPFIRELTRASGDIIRAHFLTGVQAEMKRDQTPVTVADRRAEEAMRELIMRHYPDHGILGEEGGAFRTDASYCWVLDPIDGTRAFLSNCFIFGTLVALSRNGRPLLGAIHSPLTGHLLIGSGTSAWVNDRPVAVRHCHGLEDAFMLASSHWEVFRHRNGPAFEALSRRVRCYRTWGDCHGYFQVATGGADIMLDPILEPWDIMALIPVIEGAGGRITDWHGDDPVTGKSAVATSGPLHNQVVALLNP